MQKIVTFLTLGLVLLLLTGCKTGKHNPTTAISPWPSANPAQEGIAPAVINGIHEDILSGKYGFIDRFLLIRNEKVLADYSYAQDYRPVMEKYDATNHMYNYDHIDWHPFYRGTRLHTLQSVTKSVTSLLLGIAIDEGHLANEEEMAMSFFETYDPDLSDDRRRSMTVGDLLTMRSGIGWNEDDYQDPRNSCILLEASSDWIRFIIDQPMDAEPGQTFAYNSGASVLLGKIVRQATGRRIDKWAEEKLFAPLGITDYYWKITPKGEVDTEGGLYLTSYDLAKIGHVMMNEGLWQGKRIVSAEWVNRSIAPSVRFDEDSGYGYQWWVPRYEDGETKIFAGNGYGGQFLLVVPEEDLVLVFNGWNIHGRPEKSSWQVLEGLILPALGE